MTSKQQNIALIGCGNMAHAILSGVTSTGFISSHQILALSHHKTKDRKFAKQHKIRFIDDVKTLLQKTSIILLAVKPKSMNDVLTQIKPHLKNHLIMTVAAGLQVQHYQKHLHSKIKLVRAMPNTPSQINLGVTALYFTKNIPSREKTFVMNFFANIGSVYELKSEKLIHTVVATSGSGPAFVFSYIDALLKSAVAHGLDRNTALEMLVDTLVGSSLYMKQSGKSADDLIKQVASKGGTTEAGLVTLHKKGFANTLTQCFNATRKKSVQMSHSK